MDNTRYEKILEELRKQSRAQQDADVLASDRVYQAQIRDRQQQAAQTRAGQERDYEKKFDEEAVEQLIRQRRVAEEMASFGLYDSGLHALEKKTGEKSFERAISTLSAEKQAAIDALARQMDEQIGVLEGKKQQAAEKIRSDYDEDARRQATSLYQKELTEEAKKAAASGKTTGKTAAKTTKTTTPEEAEAKAKAQRISDRNTLITNLNKKTIALEGKKALINAYLSLYGIQDPEEGTLVLDGDDEAIFGELVKSILNQKEAPAEETKKKTYRGQLRDNALLFSRSVLTEEEFVRRRNQAMVDGKVHLYEDYTQYIADVRRSWFEQGKLDAMDVARLLEYYGA